MNNENIKEYLKNMADNVILPGHRYDVRIDIDDGGFNSYVGIYISSDDFHRKQPVTAGVQLHRHTNNAKDLENTWRFELGGVCNPYADNPDVALYFGSYGKSADDAAKDAEPYLSKLLTLIKKQVALQKKDIEKTKQAERESLLARLKDLEDGGEI